ncbi:MAG: DUF4912 domain-containing protein [Acidobacteriota bacterium]
MSKGSKKKDKFVAETEFIEFVPADELISSGEFVESGSEPTAAVVGGETLAPATKLDEMPPVFRELADPKLPELGHQNRARLQMQSPNRLFFYWSVGSNPFHKLNKALGAQTASYSLVLKLVDLKRDLEEIHPVEAEGSWWFDVEADGEYMAEIGFYAPNRPYVRALFSNTVGTPRKSPSPRVDTEEDWSISADRFARVLEVAGFTEDAFEVALAGDDIDAAEASTQFALVDLTGVESADARIGDIAGDEIRYALLLLAAGTPLEGLRWKISPALFALLEEYASALSSEKALAVLKERFDIEADEITEEEFGSAVFGASSINFPRRLKTRRTLPKLNPLSSSTSSRRA